MGKTLQQKVKILMIETDTNGRNVSKKLGIGYNTFANAISGYRDSTHHITILNDAVKYLKRLKKL